MQRVRKEEKTAYRAGKTKARSMNRRRGGKKKKQYEMN